MAQVDEADVDFYEEWENRYWDSLLAKGHSEQEVQLKRDAKKSKENVSMYLIMEDLLVQNMDESGSWDVEEVVEIALGLAIAQEKLARRPLAISALQRALKRVPDEPRLGLALGGLLFRDDCKQEAELVYQCVVDSDSKSVAQTSAASHPSNRYGANALFMLGWIAIHCGDHTKAYVNWLEGYGRYPEDERFIVQFSKRTCWDQAEKDDELQAAPFVGSIVGPFSSEDSVIYDVCDTVICTEDESGLDAFQVDTVNEEPALRLFDPSFQERRVVFRTRAPLLSAEECQRVIAAAEAYATARGGWGTVRQVLVCTVC